MSEGRSVRDLNQHESAYVRTCVSVVSVIWSIPIVYQQKDICCMTILSLNNSVRIPKIHVKGVHVIRCLFI